MKLLHLKVSKSASLLFVSFLFCFSAFSQVPNGHVRCSTTEMDSIRHAQNPELQTNEEFEQWLEKLIAEKKKRKAQGLIIDGVYQIPVVVHVLHDGEAVGTGRNLSVAAVQSQIDVLNEDFRRIFGTNGYNTHPDGADTQIEFCLAKRRPDGSAFPAGEDGINRVDAGAQFGGGPTYATATIDGTIKPWFTATQFGGWDPADYMNFWSIDLQGGLLGYAQFPTTVLGGMGCNAQNVTTDGVVMDYASIGKSAVTGFGGVFNEGRTATHEIGHWLGLRHIWGDGGCGVDDFCLDTPESDASNGGCPTGHVSCGTVDMIENYMDYTNDLCMNIFTNDQKMRMRTVLENSPIRASLITSDACIPPAVSDASITGIIDPDGDNCAGSITPTVILRNRGSSNLTSATINYTINGVPAGTFSWTGSIAPGAENNVVLPAFTAPLGVHEFKAFSELPNGVTDPDPTYDTTTIFFAVSNGIQPNYSQDFDGGVFPPDVRWSVDNPNSDCYEWVGQACVSSTGVSNNVAAQMTNYNNGTNQDEYLYTPYFILPCNATAANVSFDKAYRRRIAGSNDRLRLEMSDDCGATWSTVLFDQSGGTLDGPNGTSNSYWIPTAATEWQNVNIDLLPYVTGTSQSVQFRFRATNDGNGGNLYVDNFNYTAVTPGEIEVTVAGVDVLDGGIYDFGAAPVGGTVTATFTISNPGTSDLILTGPINVTGAPEFVLNSTFGTTTVPAGGTTTFTIDFTASGAGPFAGTVSFGTNDCDEGLYDFILGGTGDVSPPTAAFTVAPPAICEGQTVTYTSTSSGATSYSWTFTGGTPASATGVGPHVVTYATAGTYNASLTVTNPYGSDTDTQVNAVAVTAGTGTVLPIIEGFDGGTFAPTGWNVGNGGNQAITWTQDPNNNGTAPTAGNSARIDFFSTNTAGDQDTLFVVPADFAGYSAAQLTYDVAYARYNATYSDRMQVIVSTDCGNSWSVELDQAGTALATDADQTGAYTAPSTWRNETVDLSAYVGNSNVRVAFVGISGWGQYLYVDNVNLSGTLLLCTDPDVPTVTSTPGSYCEGDVVTLNIAGNLNDATSWSIYSGSCGGTLIGTTVTSTYDATLVAGANDFFVRGEGGCVAPGGCGTVSVTAGAPNTGSENVTACDSYTWSANGTTYTTGGSYTALLTNVSGCDSTATLNLTINNSTSGSESVTACDSYTWSANGTTYTTSGAYTATLTNAAGCDSTATLNLTINNSTSGSENVTACDTYTWPTNGTTYTTSGAYAATLTNAAGCDSTVTLNLTINNATSGSESVTACDTYTWSANGTTYTTSGAYTATLTNAAGCDSTATLNLTINNATSGSENVTACDTYTWSANGTTYTTSGSYTATLTNAAGCDSTATLNLTINNSTSGSESLTACDSYTWSANGTTYTTSGVYTATLTNAAGCDSTATLNLTINNSTSGSESVTACDSYTWSANGTTYTTSGAYTATLTNAAGCDSTATLNLTINNATSGSESVTACDSYTWSANGTTYTTSGSYTATLTNAAGCDSTATLNLTINTATSSLQSAIACDSYTWSANGTTYTTSGTYTATLTNAAGCDSTVFLSLTINNSTSGSESVTACNDYTWSANGTTYTTSGTYTATLTNSQGCDSTATLNLTITTFATGTDVITACDTYTWIDGVTYTASNNTATHSIVGGSVNGCDSIVSLDLTINNATSGSESVTACDSYTWSANGTTYTTSGSYTATLTNATGCDSTATLNLTINNATSGSESVTACDSYTWSANGTTYTTSGAYTATLTNAAGCDSTATLNLTINNSTSGSENVTACDSYTWSANGTTYTTSGAYTATLTNAAGCDSTATLNLTINNSTSGSESVTACDSYTWSANGTTYTTSGSYTATLTNAAGCDSTATLNLTINTATSSLQSAIACDSYTWSANGTTYTTSGTYTATLTNAAGCDSTVFLSLTINNSTSGSESVTACNDYTWSANGTTYTTSGTYTATLTNSQGCDSTATLNLTITTFATGTDVITACDTYTWIDGVTYTASNNTATHTIVGGSVNGCDSIVSLDLTINNSTSGSESVTACDTYTWPANGTTYASSGTFTTTLTNAAGCDSTVTLNLTINNSTSGSESVTSCSNYTWSANGTTYTTSGTYTATLTNVAGCDSTATLNLTIGTPTSGSESVTACDTYTWSANGTTYTTSGTYTATLTNSQGCDSTATLNLTINNSSSGSESVTACDSYTWSANGTTYTTSGAYTETLTNAVGCDSTVTLNLTINTSTTGSESITACESYTWSATGVTYTTGGSYTATIPSSNGCDSVVTLNLTLNSATTGSETASACEFYTWPTNGTTYTSSGVYTTVLTNSTGCDSVVTLNLTINIPTSGTETATVCDSYVWSADGNTYTTTGMYTAILTNAAGCDSIVTLDLTVLGLPTVGLSLTTDKYCETDASVSLAGGSPAGGTYSGVGVSGGMFSPSTAGSGTFAITYTYTDGNGCTATAVDSITVQDCSGIDEIEGTVVAIYPNPTNGAVTLESNGAILDEVKVFDNAGKLIDIISIGTVSGEIDLSDYATGVYQFQIKAGTSIHWERIVKN